MLIPGISIVRPQNIKPNDLRILPLPEKQKQHEDLSIWRWIGNIALIGAGILAETFTFGLSVPISVAIAGADIGLNTYLDYRETGKVDPLSIALPVLSALGPAVSALNSFIKTKQAAKLVGGLESTINLTGKAKTQMLEGFENVLTKKIGAKNIAENLAKAGLNEQEILKNLKLMKNYMEENKVLTSQFGKEIDFMNKEQEIFKSLGNPLQKLGLSFNDLFEPLSKMGINVVDVETTSNLVKLIKSDKVIYEAVAENKGLLKALEYQTNQTLSPNLWTRLMNAKKIEQGARKLNEMLSLINPSNMISKILDKTLGKVKDKIFEKIWIPAKEKVEKFINKLMLRDAKNRRVKGNGVYPCFKSGWINYLRAVKFGPNKYKIFVIFRKWGYQPVLISELLPLEFVLKWSDSESPGRIYHEFRKKYATPKGEYVSLSILEPGIGELFNMLGFIPDKYISLGVSLVSNIQSGIHVLQQGAWYDLINNPKAYLKEPLIGKFEEMIGGQFGVAMANQLSGKSPTAMKDYFKGKIQEHIESKESAYRKQTKATRGSLESIKSIKGIIK